jgi:threonine synthase
VTPSISPSMDIQVSSNFERALFDAYGRDGGAVAQLMDELKAGGFHISQGALEALRAEFASGRASEAETSRHDRAGARADGGASVPPFRGRRPCGAGLHRDDAARHAGHRASREIPRRGGGRDRHPPALPPRMADLLDRPERVRASTTTSPRSRR